MAPNPATGLVRGYTNIIRRTPREGGGRDWNDASAIHGRPRTADNYQKLGEIHSHSDPPEETHPK